MELVCGFEALVQSEGSGIGGARRGTVTDLGRRRLHRLGLLRLRVFRRGRRRRRLLLGRGLRLSCWWQKLKNGGLLLREEVEANELKSFSSLERESAFK